YVSNTNEQHPVYFDNLNITHHRGALLEETSYYPFGLTMDGISSKAAGSLENKRKYNGIEQNEDLDLNVYDAFYRTYDTQIGRWWQIDPKAERAESWSPYAANFDNPISFNDPLGDYPPSDGNSNLVNSITKNKNGTYTISETTTIRKTTDVTKTALQTGKSSGGIDATKYQITTTQQVSIIASTTTIDAKGNVISSSSVNTSHNEVYNHLTIEANEGGKILEIKDMGGTIGYDKQTVTNGSMVGPFAKTAQESLSGPYHNFPVRDDAQIYINIEFGDNALTPLIKAASIFRKGSDKEEKIYEGVQKARYTAKYSDKYDLSTGDRLGESNFKSGQYPSYQKNVERASAVNKGGKPKVN
ncbi:MAG: hypothetical protein EAY72_13450, partial [Bacteroidetes bacterium]